MTVLPVKLRPSYALAYAFIFMHGCSVIIVLCSLRSFCLSVPLSLLCFLSCLYYVKRYALLTDARSTLEIQPCEHAWLVRSRRSVVTATLCGNSIVTSRCLLLNFKVAKRRFSAIILPDSLTNAEFRVLYQFLCHFEKSRPGFD